MKTRCIIKGKQKYEVSEYDTTYGAKPLECVLTQNNNDNFNTYEFINGVKIKFKDYKHQYDKPLCEFSFENRVFKKIEKEDFNLQTIVNYMNEFMLFSKKELEDSVELAEQNTKPQLQLEIEELNAKIERLKSKIDIYTQIDVQYEKIKELLSKLEE